MSDDDDYYFFEDDYYTESDHDWYDDDDDDIDFDDYGICGMGDTDLMDYESYQPKERDEQQVIYDALNMPYPDNTSKNALPLLDICASKIALNFPFAYIEDRNPPIPENVQLKIISASFPQNMEKIKRYCSLNNGSSTEFDKGVKMVKSVKDLTQIGFHLSANVECRGYREVWYGGPPGKKSPYLYVNVKFDRGKITETNCPCESNSSWCFHVIAVCLARIFFHDKCTIKPPLSDTLNSLTTYAQLRTFTQYLIAEFSDRRIVESAQNVLDRMIKPKKSDDDAINETWGAPDPTAGSGFDETAHWLICEEGLKARCGVLIQSSDVTERSWGTNIADSDMFSASVLERWRSTQIEKPVEDYFKNLDSIPGSILYCYNHHKKTYPKEKSQAIAQFLKTCEELLRDDFGYSLKAVQTFTVQLMDIMEERNKRNLYRVGREKFESNHHLSCTPRPQMCWLFRDQLARLWRLLVLNPSICTKDREEIFTTLEVLEAKLHSNDGKKQYFEWDSPKHIQYLKNSTWESLQLSEDPFKTDSPSDISVVNSIVIKCNNGQRLATGQLSDPTEQFPLPIELSCGNFASSVTVYCYLVEALSVYGKTEQAVHLAMNLALAVVRYYGTWLEGSFQLSTQNALWIDCGEKQANETGKKGKSGKKRRQNRKRGRTGSKKTEDENEKPNEILFDQVKGIIPITSIAYLMDLLDQNQHLLAEMLKLVKLKGLGLSEEELMECDDVTSDAKSLIFRLGVVGLGLPKIQAPSLQIQIEWFNWEVFVSDKLMKLTPSTGDVEFLKMFTVRLIGLCEFGFHPPHALAMNLFHHTYKANQFDDGFSVATKTIASSKLRYNDVNVHRRMFEECLRRHWVKLCEVVLCEVSVNASQSNHALECLFTAANMIGTTGEPEKKVSLQNKKSTANIGQKSSSLSRLNKLSQCMLIEKVVANLYLAYAVVCYADSLTCTTDKQSLIESKKLESLGLPSICNRTRGFPTFEETKKASAQLTEQQKSLYQSAITLASRAFAVKNFKCVHLKIDDYNFAEFMQRSLKWVCNISSKIGAKAFDLILERQRVHSGPVKCFNNEEVIKICTTMLDSEQKREELVWVKARTALLSLFEPESNKEISNILSLCRSTEKEPSSKRALLVPAICKHVLHYVPGSSMDENSKVENLATAMVTMHGLCMKMENEDGGESLRGVEELFSEGTTDKPTTSNDSCKKESLDPNLQLCFDLAVETIKHVRYEYRVRTFEVRRTCENACSAATYVAKKASKSSEEEPVEEVILMENAKIPSKKTDPYTEVYINRFIEVVCNHIQDYLLLTDFFFELSSRLLALPQHASFGRDRVLLSDDIQLASFCQSCSSLSVLLKRCIAGLVKTTQGEEMEKYIKDTAQDNTTYCKSRARNAKFYHGVSLVSFLDVLKRVMSISPEDEFEPFSYKLASKHPILKTAIEEVNNKSSSSPPEEAMFSENQLISSLLLRRMFSPALSFFDYDDDDGWRY